MRARAAEAGYAELAREYGVSATTIARIAKGETYRRREQWNAPRPGPKLGSAPPNKALTDREACEARWRYEHEDVTGQQLADQYGVSQAAMYMLLQGRTYRRALRLVYTPDGTPPNERMRQRATGRRPANAKLSLQQARNARRKYVERDDVSMGDLADQYGVSRASMRKLLHGDTYADESYDPAAAKAKAERMAERTGLGRSWTQRRRRRPEAPELVGLRIGTRQQFVDRLHTYYRDEFGLPATGRSGGHAIGATRWFAELVGESYGGMRKRVAGEDGCAPRRRHWVVLHLLEQARRARIRAKAAERTTPEGSPRAAFARFR